MKTKIGQWPGSLLLPAAVIAAVFLLFAYPLLGTRFLPTHDGEYHIIRFMEFFRMLAAGIPFPRWAPTLNSGYGMPLFIFHYPFPNYAGALLHVLGLQFVDAFKVSLALAYLTAAVGCYAFLSAMFGKRQAVVGTVAMLAVPYWFVDIYVRGAVGEVWAIAWLFLALAALFRKNGIGLALTAGLLIVSHNILAMLFIPVLTVATAVRNRRLLTWIALGIGLSAYFWLPALGERGFVTGLNSVDYRDHFAALDELLIPSWGTEFSGNSVAGNKMSLQLGLAVIAWFVWAGALALRDRDRRRRTVMLAVAAGPLVVSMAMLPLSGVVWKVVTPLQYVQYPWRLLSYVIVLLPVAAAYAAGRSAKWATAVLCIVGLLIVLPYAQPVTYERRDDAYYLARPNFTDGTSSMGNSFSTVWTPWKEHRAVTEFAVATGSAVLGPSLVGFTEKSVTVVASSSAVVAVNTLYYPGWTAVVDGKPVGIDHTTDGTIRVLVPAGRHTLNVSFGETPLRTAADVVSLLSLMSLLVFGIRSGYAKMESGKS
jgi:hypothetical protein